MIAKSAKGKGFRGALDYDLGKEHGRLIDSNMAGDTPRALAAEFGEIRRLRPRLTKAVLHVSLSAAPGEKLSDEQWRAIGQRYLKGMGLDDNQYVLTRHTDTEHEHVHLLANRIRFDGSVTSDSHDWRRQEALMRDIERDLGLQAVAPSREAVRRAPTQGESRARRAHRRALHPRPPAAARRRRRRGLPRLHPVPGAARSRRRRARCPSCSSAAPSSRACPTGSTASP